MNDSLYLNEDDIEDICSILSSAIDGWDQNIHKDQYKLYKKMAKKPSNIIEREIYIDRIISSFLSFCYLHGIEAFIDYLQSDFGESF